MNRRILCVDDEEAILKGLKLHIRKDFEMFTATNGAEGLEVFENDGPFSVVTADMRMPGMDGATMLAKIKELNPNVSTILLTGHADFEFGGAAALQSGQIFQILTKPCPPEKLIKTLEEAILEYHSKAGQEPDG
ncbi:MAG: response regulator [Opitutales bacterium]